MSHECHQQLLIKNILNKLEIIENKIDNIIAWKYKIIGAISIIGIIISYIANLFIK